MKNEEKIVDSQPQKNLLEETFSEDFQPVQKNTKIFKFLLYSSKIEIKSNSFIKTIYSTSLFEIALWLVGLLLFISSPKTLYLIWPLSLHIGKGILGLILIEKFPKTFEIMDIIYKKEDIEDGTIVGELEKTMKELFFQRWKENRIRLFVYFLLNVLCIFADGVIFFIQLILFGKVNYFSMQIGLLFLIIVFFISDIIYFLWFFTLRLTFPEYMISPMINAIIGSMKDLNELFLGYFRRKSDN
jgi:hypothetical protein